MYKVEDVVEMAQMNSTCVNGKWVPARPINFQVRSLKERVKEAWAVFTGKADALVWPEEQ